MHDNSNDASIFCNGVPQELLDELKQSLAALKTLGWKEMRPWNEFFASFKPPEMKPDYVSQRVAANLLHYRSNYIFICAMVFLLRITFSPLLLITLAICAGLAYYSFVVHSGPFRIGEMLVDQRMKAYVAGGACVVLLILTGSLEALLWGLLSSLLLCGMHAFFRPRNIASRANHAYEEIKLSWFGIGLASSDSGSGSRKKADSLSPDDPENPPVFDVSGRDRLLGDLGHSPSAFGEGTSSSPSLWPPQQQQLHQGDVRKRGAGAMKGNTGIPSIESVPSSKYD
jgi:hypothetical protein